YYEKLKGSAMACIGFILSPLSWWNDLYVNIPIAYFCAWVFSLFYPDLFMHAFVVSYLATNVLGFVLLHKGIRKTLSKDDSQKVRYGWKDFLKDLAISLLYTFLIVILVKLNVILPFQEYKAIMK
ncbi:MAG TPA: hypothetical protein DHW81_05705, partial [Nitrospiraceae bacterium]|nr:hypothetical protein [Nitrospiraceae bacterium]